MILFDVNVLLYAHREETARHIPCRDMVEQVVNGQRAFGFSELIGAGFLRVVTHPRVFEPPSPLPVALQFIDAIRLRPNCVLVTPGPGHWQIFTRLCEEVGAKGNLIPDAFLAALAIESGCTWVTTDRDYSRFPGLEWKSPNGV